MWITRFAHWPAHPSIAALIVAATTTLGAQAPGFEPFRAPRSGDAPASEHSIVSSFDAPFIGGRAPVVLRQADDGSFYGITSGGGLFDRGTLFRMDADGAVSLLHTFAGPTDGAQPSGLVKASDGRFYGLTSQGGESGSGTVFRFAPGAALTTLHSFSETDVAPVDLLAASDGNVYGLTARGGDFNNGTIFMVDPGGSFTTIYHFDLSAGSGMTSLIKGSDGRFYGTARQGGDAGFGTVFAVDETGMQTILHSFTGAGAGDGASPLGLIQSRDGRLYGTTQSGGEFTFGTVYSISVTGNYTLLHSFSNTTTIQPAHPRPDLVEAIDGAFYGAFTTQIFDRFFRIDSSGMFTNLSLGTSTATATGELIQAADGRLYGPTTGGGTDGGGAIIRLGLEGSLATVYEFPLGADPGSPNGVIQARDGQFYGTTGTPRSSQRSMIGTVFAMDGAGARTTLHTFSGIADAQPMSNLFEGADGSLYGTTFNEAEFPLGPGYIFTISPAGVFTSLAFGSLTRAGVIQARDGNLYGTSAATRLESSTYGSVFRVEANRRITSLHEFDGTDSANPVAELVEIDDGTLYGTTEGGAALARIQPLPPPALGAIFRLDPATSAFTIRYRFNGPDGSKPLGRLLQGTDGLIYGTTSEGGAHGFGTVFCLDAAGTLTILHHFAGTDGANPSAGVIQGFDGRLYGTTTNGGAFGYGTVFAISVIGGLTTLHDFRFSDGAHPLNELIQSNDGAFYGAASLGGPRGGGVIFRVRPATSTPDRYFEIVSRNSGQCLDVYGASTDPVASLIQWTCHGGPNQQWRLEPVAGGGFHIIARHSGQVLDVYGAWLDDVTPIIQYPLHGGDNQVWTLEDASDGYVSFIARHSGKAMDVEFGSTDDGARVIQYAPHGGSNQQWLLRPVE